MVEGHGVIISEIPRHCERSAAIHIFENPCVT